MPIIESYPTAHFVKAYKSLPQDIRSRAREKEEIFKANPFDPRLKTHKLKGRLKD